MFGNLGIGELILIILFLILWIIALIDILRNNFQGYNKLVWIIVVIFLPIIGALLYLTIGKNQKVSA